MPLPRQATLQPRRFKYMKTPRTKSFNLSWYTTSLRMIEDITDRVQLESGFDVSDWLDVATHNETPLWACVTNGPYRFCGGSFDPQYIIRVLTAFHHYSGWHLPARIEREITPGQRRRLFLANDDPQRLAEFSDWVNKHAWRY